MDHGGLGASETLANFGGNTMNCFSDLIGVFSKSLYKNPKNVIFIRNSLYLCYIMKIINCFRFRFQIKEKLFFSSFDSWITDVSFMEKNFASLV